MWTKRIHNNLAVGIQWIWKDPNYHCINCYICSVKTSGYNKKNKCKIEYSILTSTLCQVLHSAEISLRTFCLTTLS